MGQGRRRSCFFSKELCGPGWGVQNHFATAASASKMFPCWCCCTAPASKMLPCWCCCCCCFLTAPATHALQMLSCWCCCSKKWLKKKKAPGVAKKFWRKKEQLRCRPYPIAKICVSYNICIHGCVQTARLGGGWVEGANSRPSLGRPIFMSIFKPLLSAHGHIFILEFTKCF